MQNKIVAISDTHLGQCGADVLGQYSLLSTRSAGNLVEPFAREVQEFAGRDRITLVVVGDFLDLSLSYVEDALIDMCALFEAVRVDEIIYQIGNHDIEMWSLHCEDKNLLTALRNGELPSSDAADPTGKALYKITSGDGEPFTLLQPLVDRVYGAGKVPIRIAYPSYTVTPADGALCYFFHGHLDARLYSEISDLLHDQLSTFPHERIAATVNQPLIGLLFWLLGEMGEGMGADGLIERIYTDLQRGSDSQLQKIIERLVAQLLPSGAIPGVPDNWERAFVVHHIMSWLGRTVLAVSSGASRDRHAKVEKTLDELWRWIQVVPSLRERAADTTHDTVVVFGHTHTPILRYQYPGTAMTVWNLGTWLVEPGHEFPRTGFLGIDTDGSTTWVDVGDHGAPRPSGACRSR